MASPLSTSSLLSLKSLFSSSSRVQSLNNGVFPPPPSLICDSVSPFGSSFSSALTSSSRFSLFPQVLLTRERGKNKRMINALGKHGIYGFSNDANSNTHYTILCHSSSTPPMTVPLQKASKRKRTKYRKQYPGENVGITEEMRFVAMRLRNVNGKKLNPCDNDTESEKEEKEEEDDDDDESKKNEGETWRPSKEGFLKYLVDSKLVFDTIERIVDKSDDVSYAYFRRTGLERSQSLEKDLEWFKTQNLAIPDPSHIGVSYAKYLEEQAEEDAPLFLSHFYSIYFSHIAGGQVIVRKVSKELLEGKELEFNKWERGEQDLLRGVREKLNMLGEHWTRDEKNKCLKETAKAFKYMGQIVRLIIL